ncbi:MAG: minor capsid protein [Clostridiales bacterium]|jgi:hypothetical protein|nr:minor capsid protein [Clostridiales bacterium]
MRITDIKVNLDGIKTKINGAIDDGFMTFAHAELKRLSDKYVPFGYYNKESVGAKDKGQGGILAGSAIPSAEYLEYAVPYAHYQYAGKVMNMRTKTYTGAELQYTTEKHPLAGKEWDKAMIRSEGHTFTRILGKALERRLK